MHVGPVMFFVTRWQCDTYENVVTDSACRRRRTTAAVLVNPKEAVDLVAEVLTTRPVFGPYARELAGRIGLQAEGLGQPRLAKDCPFGGRPRTRLD